MKRKYLFPLSLVLLLAAGCLKSSQDIIVDNAQYPLGTFSGKFSIVHRNLITQKADTTTTNNFILSLATTGFAVSGDTTLHAASHGGFLVNNTNLIFTDFTYPQSGVPKKPHLSGTYIYTFDGTNLKMGASSNDTIGYVYTLIKTGN